jgi:hypothetical protein
MMEQIKSIEATTKEAERNLDRLLDWIIRYDNRAALLFTLDATMVGTLALRLSSSIGPGYSSILLVPFILTVGISILGTAFTIFPRLKGPTDSLLYFGSIAKMEKKNFRDLFNKRTTTEYLDDLLAQCHINAKILDFKFKVFRISLILTMVAIIFWSLSLYLF